VRMIKSTSNDGVPGENLRQTPRRGEPSGGKVVASA
jgi:hypothetical protein